MKKTFMTLVAAAALMFAACGGSTTNNGTAESGNAAESKAAPAEEPIWPVDASAKLDKTFDHEKFTMKYPASLGDNIESISTFCFYDSDEVVNLRGDVFDFKLAIDLKTYASSYDTFFKSQDCPNYDEPVVKDKRGFVVRGKNDKKTVYVFMVLKDENGGGVSGQFEYPNAQAAEYDKTVGAIINSIKFK